MDGWVNKEREEGEDRDERGNLIPSMTCLAVWMHLMDGWMDGWIEKREDGVGCVNKRRETDVNAVNQPFPPPLSLYDLTYICTLHTSIHPSIHPFFF